MPTTAARHALAARASSRRARSNRSRGRPRPHPGEPPTSRTRSPAARRPRSSRFMARPPRVGIAGRAPGGRRTGASSRCPEPCRGSPRPRRPGGPRGSGARPPGTGVVATTGPPPRTPRRQVGSSGSRPRSSSPSRTSALASTTRDGTRRPTGSPRPGAPTRLAGRTPRSGASCGARPRRLLGEILGEPSAAGQRVRESHHGLVFLHDRSPRMTPATPGRGDRETSRTSLLLASGQPEDGPFSPVGATRARRRRGSVGRDGRPDHRGAGRGGRGSVAPALVASHAGPQSAKPSVARVSVICTRSSPSAAAVKMSTWSVRLEDIEKTKRVPSGDQLGSNG